jgi:methylenetetrahydrofolate reductase (NADPH)
VQRIASMCKAMLPDAFVADLAAAGDEAGQFAVGVEYATRQVSDLVRQGVPGLHFYVLNKSQAAASVLAAVTPPRG